MNDSFKNFNFVIQSLLHHKHFDFSNIIPDNMDVIIDMIKKQIFFLFQCIIMSQDKEKEVSFIFQYEVFSQLTFEDLKKKIYFNY